MFQQSHSGFRLGCTCIVKITVLLDGPRYCGVTMLCVKKPDGMYDPESAHKILHSYLSGREQVTKFQRKESEKCGVEYGVPQDQFLDPYCF